MMYTSNILFLHYIYKICFKKNRILKKNKSTFDKKNKIQFFNNIFIDIENEMIYTQDILVTNEKGDDAPPNQSKMTTIFKYTLNTQDAA